MLAKGRLKGQNPLPPACFSPALPRFLAKPVRFVAPLATNSCKRAQVATSDEAPDWVLKAAERTWLPPSLWTHQNNHSGTVVRDLAYLKGLARRERRGGDSAEGFAPVTNVLVFEGRTERTQRGGHPTWRPHRTIDIGTSPHTGVKKSQDGSWERVTKSQPLFNAQVTHRNTGGVWG